MFWSYTPENDHRLHKAPEPIPNSEAKLLLAHLVLPWGTRWESWVLFSFFCGFKKPFFFFLGPKKATSSVRTKTFFVPSIFFPFVVQKDALTMSSRVHVLVHAGPDSSRTQLVRVPKTKTTKSHKALHALALAAAKKLRVGKAQAKTAVLHWSITHTHNLSVTNLVVVYNRRITFLLRLLFLQN